MQKKPKTSEKEHKNIIIKILNPLNIKSFEIIKLINFSKVKSLRKVEKITTVLYKFYLQRGLSKI